MDRLNSPHLGGGKFSGIDDPGEHLIRAAAVRWPFRWASERAAFVAEMADLVGQAVRQGASLVALPLHVGTALLGMLYGGIVPLGLEVGIGVALEIAEVGEPVPLRHHSAFLRQLYGQVFGGLAAAFGVWLAAGSLLWADEQGRMWHETTLFAPDGRPAGSQRACHRSNLEQAWGIFPSQQLAPIPTSVGPVGLLVGEDVGYPEVGRILALQGARILIHLSAGGADSPSARRAGLWREVQANQLFGVESSLAPGVAALHCPVEMAPDGRGILAESAAGSQPAVLVATLDEVARQQVLTGYRVAASYNLPWYRQVFPGIYG